MYVHQELKFTYIVWISCCVNNALNAKKLFQKIQYSNAIILLINLEPGETFHKYIRYYRAHHAVQTTLIENLKCVFFRCMQISDPVNLKLMSKNEPPRKATILPEKVKALLVNAPASDDQVVPSGSGDNNMDTDIETDIDTDINPDSDTDRDTDSESDSENEFYSLFDPGHEFSDLSSDSESDSDSNSDSDDDNDD